MSVPKSAEAPEDPARTAVSYVDKLEEARARRAALIQKQQTAANLPDMGHPKVPMLEALRKLPEHRDRQLDASKPEGQTFTTRPVSAAQMQAAQAAASLTAKPPVQDAALAPRTPAAVHPQTASTDEQEQTHEVAIAQDRVQNTVPGWLINTLVMILILQVSYAAATFEFGLSNTAPEFAPPVTTLAAQPIRTPAPTALPAPIAPVALGAAPRELASIERQVPPAAAAATGQGPDVLQSIKPPREPSAHITQVTTLSTDYRPPQRPVITQ